MKKAFQKILWIFGTTLACILWFAVECVILIPVAMIKAGAGASPSDPTATLGTVFPAILYLIGVVAICIISSKLWKRFSTRCPICKKYAAIELVQTDVLKKTKISMLMELKHKDKYQNVIGTHEEYIPGTRTTYRDIYRCKFCGHETTRTYTKDTTNT